MKNRNLYLIIALVVSAAFSSCQKQDQTEQQDSIQVSGVLSGKGALAGVAPTINYPLLITAKLNGLNYLSNVPSTMYATSGQITFNSGAEWFYPLNHSTLQFYAFTPPATGDVMALTSGTAITSDALLSNKGGTGTAGSSVAQISQLEFSHVMTKLTVIVNITDPLLGSWQPTTFQFTMNNVFTNGSYRITSVPGAPATSLSGSYAIKLGDNYLVPSGATLAGKLTSLVIDNYRATTADLASFTINTTSGGPFVLNPGCAYTLTFNINRLQLQSIVVTMGNWNSTNLTNNAVTYVAQNLNLNLGAYVANDIVKVEVINNSGEMFTGSVSGGVASFVLAPTSVSRVNLYTSTGLLLTTPNASISGNALTITNLNSYGMLPQNPQLPYDAVTNPYAVSTEKQFRKIDGNTAYNYIQTANLNMQGVSMSPIVMLGSYNGNGFQINEINVAGSGLFASVAPGQTVQNVNVSSGTITQTTPNNYVGGICGTNNGTIVASINNAILSSATPQYMGGICGLNKGQVIACLNTGNISGVFGSNSYIGGICGYNQYATGVAVTASINMGMLTATGTSQQGVIAGICGYSVNGGSFAVNYWLTGTAALTIGGSQVAVNGSVANLTLTDLADLSQQRMRETNTLSSLNSAIPTFWSAKYGFTMSQVSWPKPIAN